MPHQIKKRDLFFLQIHFGNIKVQIQLDTSDCGVNVEHPMATRWQY